MAATIGDGWVLDAGWTNDTGEAIKTFTAQWLVPKEPAADGQTLFLFIGLKDDNNLLQCILQWGQTQFGGGQYWSATCFQVTGIDPAAPGAPVAVNKGDLITASIELLNGSGAAFYYRISINGQTLDCKPVPELKDCCITLEIYAVDDDSELPPDPKTLVDGITLQNSSGAVLPAWKDNSQPNPDGQHINILGSDQVEFYYHTTTVPSSLT